MRRLEKFPRGKRCSDTDGHAKAKNQITLMELSCIKLHLKRGDEVEGGENVG